MRHSPNQLVGVEEDAVHDLRNGSLKLVDEALDSEVSVLVEWQEVDSVEDIHDVCLVQTQRRQELQLRQKLSHTDSNCFSFVSAKLRMTETL